MKFYCIIFLCFLLLNSCSRQNRNHQDETTPEAQEGDIVEDEEVAECSNSRFRAVPHITPLVRNTLSNVQVACSLACRWGDDYENFMETNHSIVVRGVFIDNDPLIENFEVLEILKGQTEQTIAIWTWNKIAANCDITSYEMLDYEVGSEWILSLKFQENRYVPSIELCPKWSSLQVKDGVVKTSSVTKSLEDFRLELSEKQELVCEVSSLDD